MKTPLLSVIVPIYNKEKYITNCIESIINQSYDNLQIILVNDGSTDGCDRICQRYQERDNRIKVINKKNGGISSARNNGLRVANGDYITFVDADDFVDTSTYLHAIELLVSHNNIDILQYPIKSPNENKNVTSQKNEELQPKFLENEKDIVDALIHGKINYSSCNKVFRSEYIKKYAFQEGVRYEDTLILIQMLNDNPQICTCNYGAYYYRLNKDSFSFSKEHINGTKGRLEAILIRTNYVYKRLTLIENYADAYLWFLRRNFGEIIVFQKYLDKEHYYTFVSKLATIRKPLIKEITTSTLSIKNKVFLIIEHFCTIKMTAVLLNTVNKVKSFLMVFSRY